MLKRDTTLLLLLLPLLLQCVTYLFARACSQFHLRPNRAMMPQPRWYVCLRAKVRALPLHSANWSFALTPKLICMYAPRVLDNNIEIQYPNIDCYQLHTACSAPHKIAGPLTAAERPAWPYANSRWVVHFATAASQPSNTTRHSRIVHRRVVWRPRETPSRRCAVSPWC